MTIRLRGYSLGWGRTGNASTAESLDQWPICRPNGRLEQCYAPTGSFCEEAWYLWKHTWLYKNCAGPAGFLSCQASIHVFHSLDLFGLLLSSNSWFSTVGFTQLAHHERHGSQSREVTRRPVIKWRVFFGFFFLFPAGRLRPVPLLSAVKPLLLSCLETLGDERGATNTLRGPGFAAPRGLKFKHSHCLQVYFTVNRISEPPGSIQRKIQDEAPVISSVIIGAAGGWNHWKVMERRWIRWHYVIY